MTDRARRLGLAISRRTSPLAAAAALACVAAAAGCGVGSGGAGGGAELTVTRDYGARVLLRAGEESVPESETVIRLLERKAEIETRYGGRFVQSIDGLAGGSEDGRRRDWFFYVNGIESPIGAAEARVHGGDRVWWDYRDWTGAMRVPAVVGSWPEPFLHGSEGKRFPVRVDCLGDADDCEAVLDRLDEAGVSASLGATGARIEGELLRVVVGPWERVRSDSAAVQIEEGPARSGVFAAFEPGGDQPAYELVRLDAAGAAVGPPLRAAGLVAAVRLGDEQPTWVVTGTDESGVGDAIELLDAEDLRDRYAVAISGGEVIALPASQRTAEAGG